MTSSDHNRSVRTEPEEQSVTISLTTVTLRQTGTVVINPFLVKWAMRKYKRLRRAKRKTRRKLAEIASAYPGMFAHWRHGALPTGSTVGAV